MIKNVTITATRYKEPNWLFHETIESLSRQKDVVADVLILDQFLTNETKEYCEKLSNENINIKYIVIEAKGLSFARNYAIKECKTDVLLYIDSDAIADEYWTINMLKTFEIDNQIGIVGGKIVPKWHKSPSILAKADYVYDVYSMLDLGDEIKENSKVVGANFGLNIARLGSEAFFDENLGRKPGKLLGGEESDLCERAIKKGLKIYYNGKSSVIHQVLPERINIMWILKRMYWGGYNRGLAGGKPKASNGGGKRNMWNYFILPVILPFYAFGFLKGKKSKL
ncbi:MAG: glycosyltransferase family 2 protein [Candidatus Gracilibacteria bacterium]|nr:glycosyltransferase family 2 protein [Candidatus Gracilibacteria bacterium]